MNIFGSFFSKKPSSGDIAKQRLKVAIAQDNVNLSTAVWDDIRRDILQVLAKYVIFDESDLDIQITRPEPGSGEYPVIGFDIPIQSVRRKNA